MSDLRCPRCGAACRPGDQWCGLCYADFRPPPPAVVGDAAAPPPAPEGTPPAAAYPGGDLAPPLIRPPTATAPAPAPPVSGTPAQAPVSAAPTIPAQPTAPVPPSSASPFVPSANPLVAAAGAAPQQPAGAAPAVAVDPQAQAEAEAPELRWPCPRCGQHVPMSEDYCEACGHGFLDDVRAIGGTKLPFVGDITKLNSGQRLMFGLMIAVGVVVGLLVLFTLGGVIFH